MVLSQQPVQSSQFDSQLVNAQCSDLSVLCVRVCVCVFQKQIDEEDSFFPSTYFRPRGRLRPLGLQVLESWPKGHTAFSPPTSTWELSQFLH